MQVFRARLKQAMRIPLFWLAILYILVGVVYAFVTPVLEKTDEDGHYGYVLYIREYHTLPPLFTPSSLRSPDSSKQPPVYFTPTADRPFTRSRLASEFKQAPLYYAITAILTSWLPNDLDPDQLMVPNPYIMAAAPGLRNDNRNQYLHPPDMTPLVLASRLISLLFGLGTMIASYFLAAQLFPKRSLVPIATAAVLGFQPNFLYMATAVNNDISVTFLGALVIAILMYRLQKGPFAYFAVLLGAALGLASLAKVSGLAYIPLAGLALLIIHRGLRPAFFRDGAVIVAVALLAGGWWYARNLGVYGDPFTLRTHNYAVTIEARELWMRLRRDLAGIEYTFWAHQARIFISPIWLDRVLIWWGRISLGLLGVGVLFNLRSIWTHLPALLVLSSWPITFFVLLVGFWNQTGEWTYGRLLFPAIAPIALLFVLGWRCALPIRWRHLAAPAVMVSAGTVMVAGILIPAVTLYPLFHPSREWQAEQVQHPVGTVYVEPESGAKVVQLIGYNLPEPYASPGAYFPIELCWEPLGQTNLPYAVFVQLLDTSQLQVNAAPTAWGRRETYPGLGNRLTDRWTLHQPFCDFVFVPVFPETPTPLGASLEVGFTDPDHQNRLQAVDAEGEPITLAVAGRVPILTSHELPAAARPSRYVLDNAIGLNDAQVTDKPDGSLTLMLIWQSLRPVSYDATMFIHLKAANGNMVAQVDRQPLDGRFSTSYWLPGQVITDVVHLSPVPGADQGARVLNVGMYTWPSLQRLPVVDASGAPQRDNAIVIEVPRSK